MPSIILASNYSESVFSVSLLCYTYTGLALTPFLIPTVSQLTQAELPFALDSMVWLSSFCIPTI